MKLRFTLWWRSLFVISLTLSLLLGQVSFLKAQTPEPSQLVQQGVEEYQSQQYQEAIEFWNQALTTYRETGDRTSTVIVLENLARVYQKIGQTEKAIAFWQEVKDNYRQLGDKKLLGRSLTELAQVYSSLGQHRQAIALLCGNWHNSRDEENSTNTEECVSGSALALVKAEGDKLGEAAAKGSLGEVYRLRGDYDRAASYLASSLEVAREIDNPQLQMSALNSLGHTYSSLAQTSYRQAKSAELRGEVFGENSLVAVKTKEAKQRDKKALSYFQQSLELAMAQQDNLEQIKSLINTLPIYYRLEDFTAAANSRQKALSLVSTLPLQQTTVYAAIDLAKLLQPEKVTFNSCYRPEILPAAQTLLQQAVSLAEQLGDDRVTSFALGELGHTYECSQNYPKALELTQKARLASDKDKDSLYLWEWQTGRLLLAQGKREEGINTYETAIATLESIRDDILTANRDVQFDFRDTVEPIYRQLIDERLKTGENTLIIEPKETKKVNNVSSILTTVNALRLAELQNYFGNDCAIDDVVTIGETDLLNPDNHTAYFNTIILDDRSAIIVNFPGGKTKIVWHTDKGKNVVAEEINQFRRGLENYYNQFDTKLGENIYSWLIQPFAQDLQREQITTLVFIQDGLLRSIPMAALHDGEQFLVEKYVIATTPSLNLTSQTVLERKQLKALAFGLTEASEIDNRFFPALINVEQEINQIESILEASTGILDSNFTRDRLQQELEETSYQIVHIATHGEFSSEPEDTFLVTGNNEKLTITELDRIIRSTAANNEPVNLISLTACQTAVGDERAALGLAGVTIQAGASSALASLWSISDEFTPEVVKDFYTNIKNENMSKAKALQEAQKTLIAKQVHPALWSPFIIIGNWL